MELRRIDKGQLPGRGAMPLHRYRTCQTRQSHGHHLGTSGENRALAREQGLGTQAVLHPV